MVACVSVGILTWPMLLAISFISFVNHPSFRKADF